MCPEQGTGEEGGLGMLGRAGRLQASDAREAFQARPQVSCFRVQGLGLRVQGSGLGLSFRV